MKTIYKTIIFSVLLLNSIWACAGGMGSKCDIDDLEMPCGRFAWNFEGGALYFETEYGTVPFSAKRSENPSAGADQRTFDMNPDYGWGFYLNGTYFLEKNSDLNFNLYHFNTASHASRGLPVGRRLEADIEISAEADLTPSWFAVNLEYGHTLVNITSVNDLRLFASLAYAWLRVKTQYAAYEYITRSTVRGRNIDVANVINGDSEFKFNGIGPRVGMNLYNPSAGASWMNGIRLYAVGAIGLLIGTSESNFFYSNLGQFRKSSTTSVVELDAKFGIDYTPALFNHYVTFDAGWMGADYLSSVIISTGGKKDIFFHGVYFGAKWLGEMM